MGDESIIARLDSFSSSAAEKSYSFAGVQGQIVAYTTEDVVPALEEVQSAVDNGLYAVGFVSYEAASGLTPYLRTFKTADAPLVYFVFFAERKQIEAGAGLPKTCQFADSWDQTVKFEDYEKALKKIRYYLQSGETYQVNYTYRLQAEFEGDELGIYAGLCQAQESLFCAYLDFGRHVVVSASPELFFRVEGMNFEARPMKGTYRRGRWLQEDEMFRENLFSSEKDQAENVMITDMMRNDIGALAQVGSVQVPSLFKIERYPTVWQMTSTVKASLRSGTKISDIMTALFPCASVTGAPKIRTMEVINEVEKDPRGIYTGCIGYIAPEGDACFSVAIRTAHIDRESKTVKYGVGSGITWDSTSDKEYQECEVKARILNVESDKFDLLETLLLEDGNIFLFGRHLERLEMSAKYWDFVFDRSVLISTVSDYAEKFSGKRCRLRLCLSESGKISITGTLSPYSTNINLSVELAAEPINRKNPLIFHKTTNRSVYEHAKTQRPNVEEVLLYNEAGELTEFCIGNLVVDIDGQLFTPPVRCGLLPGTFREEELCKGRLTERVLTIDEIDSIGNIYLINSVRRYVPVDLKVGETNV